MINVTILYPKTDDSTFDIDYYKATHMPLFAKALGDACQSWGAAKVTGGKYEAIGWAIIDSQDSFNKAMAEHGAEIIGDVPNYTNVQPDIVIGEIAE